MEIDNKEKTIAGLVGLILILAGFGGNALLSESEFDNAYVCPLNEEVGVFHRLSASGKTGYYLEDGIEKKVACRSGRVYEPWIKLKDYAESKGIDPLSLIIQAKQEQYVSSGSGGAKQWLCSVSGCVPK